MSVDPQKIPSKLLHPAGRLARLHRLVGLAPPDMTRIELTDRAAVDPEITVRWWRAMGFPEAGDGDSVFGEDDLEIVSRLHALEAADLINDADVLRLARLMGASFSRITEAQISAIDDMLSAGEDVDHSLGRRERLNGFVAGADENLLELFETTMLHVWRRHMLAAFARWLSADDDMADAAVGFADIAGFTKLARELEAPALGQVVDQFESQSIDIVTALGGRVVKLIGDEIMFVCADLGTAVDIALGLVTDVPSGNLPPLRAGVAFGPTLTLGGDVFGPTVNLASRLTAVARPGTVAVTRESAELLADDFADREDIDVRRVRRAYDLKGIGRTRIAALRRVEPDEATDDEGDQD